MTDLSPEDGALVGLSTLGPDCYFKWPDTIVGIGRGFSKAARSFDRDVLERLVKDGLARYQPEWGGYALTEVGAKRVMEILLVEAPMEPIEAIAALVKFGAAVGVQKAEGDRFMVNVIMDGASYVAMHKDLSEAILTVKKKVDQALIGS
jgi:hypothetical protein